MGSRRTGNIKPTKGGEELGSFTKARKRKVRSKQTGQGDSGRGVDLAIGEAREDRIMSMLSKAKEQGVITEVVRTAHYSLEDRRGYDFFFSTPDGKKYGFQVKGTESHAQNFRNTHPGIPVIVARLRDDPEEILKHLAKEFPFLRAIKLTTNSTSN